MAIARCISTGLTVPECSCNACLRQLVERHAPELLDPSPNGGANGGAHVPRAAALTEAQERARGTARGA